MVNATLFGGLPVAPTALRADSRHLSANVSTLLVSGNRKVLALLFPVLCLFFVCLLAFLKRQR